MTETSSNRDAVETYVEQVAALIGLPISPECLEGVVDNMMRTSAIARLVMEFPLPDDLEAGPTFEP
ncbi:MULTISPECIES: DUF4089 domain-containing protein [unclassified Leptolyngbya]|uniref:DUF4089 domain-containing protein n=1 Tax=unclassified Leptolyngbya TaxID=2650499 RepID=UPI0016860A6D|nr:MULTISPECIES: DUF4089 domain-containing protein [unclassified Leptolyngbya]MBD1910865.1 DUF4089 domain-containing protein [Leptolyngbya sp. FACHB-8]MBD2153740.1 DUF4089 domain-containing protein [Leptolyngbya sp. FACHB-16]